MVGLKNSINFNNVNPNHLFPRKDLTRNRRSNVKIRDGGKSVFINDNKQLQHLENKMFDEMLNSNNNTNSCTNNEKADNIANINSSYVNNNNNNLHCTDCSNNHNSLISNNIKKINFHTCFRLLDPVISVVNKNNQ